MPNYSRKNNSKNFLLALQPFLNVLALREVYSGKKRYGQGVRSTTDEA